MVKSRSSQNHPDHPDAPERRDSGRAPVSLQVEYSHLNAFFADYTRNISQGGTFIRTAKPLAIGTEFAFRLVIARVVDPIAVRGVVQWIVSPEDALRNDTPAGMGVGFVHETEAQRRRLERTVRSLMAEQLGDSITARLLPEAQ